MTATPQQPGGDRVSHDLLQRLNDAVIDRPLSEVGPTLHVLLACVVVQSSHHQGADPLEFFDQHTVPQLRDAVQKWMALSYKGEIKQ